ncbi:MFS transporter [Ramlibacter sp. AW1]|uniref:MFS transporter n=1 Tax=Ramlibacter aurantiacus TaxID=2801330 RepID=A0A936ZWC4_9BURK|nr:MFS transporter [Ramlibacter aurantiacus]MBL0422325.1 MFS transporter [Ramlibacter aurantiacus]
MKRNGIDPSLLVIAGGIAAAVHVGKLPPALPALREGLGIGLVQGGFLISLVQLAGMGLGLFVGLAADSLGLRRTMLTGLGLLTVASLLAGLADGPWTLLVLRAVEGLGFLLAVMPGPGLVRRLVPPERLAPRLGFWGTFMPLGTGAALLAGPAWVSQWGWPSWWWLGSAISAAVALALLWWVPADPPTVAAARAGGWGGRLSDTLASRGVWLVALTFAAYSGQWLAIIGFLPSFYAQAGVSPAVAGVATALAAVVNGVGNVAAGRALQRGVPPEVLLRTGFITMALGGLIAFAPLGNWLPYLAVLAFSAVGGLIPGTLYSLAVRVAPGPGTVSTTVGWMQQWSAFGQVSGPPLVAWVASRVGGWEWSGLVTASAAIVGLLLAGPLARHGRAAGRAPA